MASPRWLEMAAETLTIASAFHPEGRREGREGEGCSLSAVACHLWLFCLYPIGQNLVTRPHLVVREVEKGNIYSRQPYNLLVFLRWKERWFQGSGWQALPWYRMPLLHIEVPWFNDQLGPFLIFSHSISVQIAFLRLCYFLEIYFPMCDNLPG